MLDRTIRPMTADEFESAEGWGSVTRPDAALRQRLPGGGQRQKDDLRNREGGCTSHRLGDRPYLFQIKNGLIWPIFRDLRRQP